MSQHIVTLNVNGHGDLEFIAGFDTRLRDFYVNVLKGADALYMSSTGLQIEQLIIEVKRQFGVEIPPAVWEAVKREEREFTSGATDVNRRVAFYDEHGKVQPIPLGGGHAR